MVDTTDLTSKIIAGAIGGAGGLIGGVILFTLLGQQVEIDTQAVVMVFLAGVVTSFFRP